MILWHFLIILSSTIRSARVSTAVSEYHFHRQEFLVNNFSDSSAGQALGSFSIIPSSLHRNQACINSNGINSMNSYYFSSQFNISNLKKRLTGKDFTIEMWLQPSINNTIDTTILSLEAPTNDGWTNEVPYNMKARYSTI